MPIDLSDRPPTPRRGGQRTPAGVWVIVALAAFFVLSAVGIGAFIVVKSLTDRSSTQAPEKSPAVANPTGSPLVSASPAATASVSTTSQATSPSVTPTIVANANASPSAAASPLQDSEDTRKDVLNRIDLMRNLSQKEKDEFYAQVERARGFRKLAVISFSSGRSAASAAQADELVQKLNATEAKQLLEDPTVVVLLVGYADTQGDEAKNLEISRTRAETLEKLLVAKTKLKNIVHSVGLGGQDFFDKANRDKNRVVEVWAVQP